MNTTIDHSDHGSCATLTETMHSPIQPTIVQKACQCGSAGCVCDSDQFVYVLGQLRPFFPTLDLQKEFAAAVTALKLQPDDYFGVFSHSYTDSGTGLSFRPYLYLAEKACWVFSINNVDTYLIVPHFENELDELIECLNQSGASQEIALVGTLGQVAEEGYCDNLRLPLVVCHHLSALPTASLAPISLKLNDGVSDAHRAINFLIFNYAAILPPGLELPKELIGLNYHPYRQNGRSIVEVILAYYNQGIEEFYACTIDVTDQYPFVDSPLRSYLPTNP